ncbi:MAG: GNAT family N-acetyltransferase [Ilumatobacteraceae bacterium]
MIDVRAARREDAELIALAHIEGWRVGYRDVLPAAFLEAPEFAQQRLDRWQAWTWGEGAPQTRVFVAVLDGEVVGFGLCGAERDEDTRATTGSGEVFACYLRPAAWGSGAAAPLITRCHEYLRDEGFFEAVLWVLRDNPRARRFYERAGWSPTGATSLFEGPLTAGEPMFSVAEVQYRISLE